MTHDLEREHPRRKHRHNVHRMPLFWNKKAQLRGRIQVGEIDGYRASLRQPSSHVGAASRQAAVLIPTGPRFCRSW